MSKLVDLLSRVGQQSSAPMGFAAAHSGRDAGTEIVLVARIRPEDVEGKSSLAESGADAFLVGPKSALDPALEAVAKAVGGRPWGVGLPELDAAQARSLHEKGCDFIVFESTATEAGVLNEDELGVVATVSTDLGEHPTRALASLPLDAILFSPPQRSLPLTVEMLMEIQRVLVHIGVPLLLEVPAGLGAGDLEALRNMGVAGVIADIPAVEQVVDARNEVAELPQRRRPGAHRDALLPPTAPAPQSPAPQPDDDDDFDDDDY